jgi:hypothetical protein
MATDKNDLVEILQNLDHADDSHWTDDGLPIVKIVQDLAGDKTITRAQLNDAAPGFSRKVAGDETGGAPETAEENNGAPPPEVRASDDLLFDDRMDPDIDGPGVPLTEAEAEAILRRRVSDSELALEASRKGIADAQAEFIRASKRVDRARADLNRRFPPLGFSENIQQHLAKQQQLLLERVTGGDGKGQLDQAMAIRNRRGWTRPERPVNNVNRVA